MDENERIYWKYDELFKRQMQKLEAWDGSLRNKELIRRFLDHLAATGTKQARRAKLTWGLRKICDWLGTDLDQVTKADIERLAARIHESHYALNTQSDYKRALKHFFRWWEDEDPRLWNGDEKARIPVQHLYKYLRDHIKTTAPPKDIDPGSILREEDIRLILEKGCRFEHERAFIRLIHETGCRIGELLGIRLKDITPQEPLWIVRVSGKTGERTIPIRDSIPNLARWLDYHPDKDNPEAYLWVSLHNRFRGQPLRYDGARRLLERCFTRAGVKKPRNPHFFRHSRSTLDAAEYTSSIHAKLRGWSPGSQMARRYEHLSGKDVQNAVLKSKGLKSKDESVSESLPVKCFCGRLNDATSRYCRSCGRPMSVGVMHEDERQKTAAIDEAVLKLAEIMSSPERRASFEKFYEAFKADGGGA